MGDPTRQDVAGIRLAKAAEAAIFAGKNVSITVSGMPDVIRCDSIKAGSVVTEIASGGYDHFVSTTAIVAIKVG